MKPIFSVFLVINLFSVYVFKDKFDVKNVSESNESFNYVQNHIPRYYEFMKAHFFLLIKHELKLCCLYHGCHWSTQILPLALQI